MAGQHMLLLISHIKIICIQLQENMTLIMRAD